MEWDGWMDRYYPDQHLNLSPRWGLYGKLPYSRILLIMNGLSSAFLALGLGFC
jgi:hypothetical protein